MRANLGDLTIEIRIIPLISNFKSNEKRITEFFFALPNPIVQQIPHR